MIKLIICLLICVIFIVLLIYIFFSKKSTKYGLLNNTCVKLDSGKYSTMDECEANILKYYCGDSKCVSSIIPLDTKSFTTLEECDNHCNPKQPTKIDMSGFPTDEKFKGALMILNATNKSINVYLDPTKPIFKENSPDIWENKDPNSQKDLDDIWKICHANFYRYDMSKKTLISSQKISRLEGTEGLKPNECWVIVLPKINNMPVWCEGNECTGSGGWITSSDSNIPPDSNNIHRPEKTMRFEFNWNENDIWYNLSAVDGLNSNIGLSYTGCNKTTSCLVELTSCPNEFKNIGIPYDWKYNTCVGPPQISSISSTCNGVLCSGCGTDKCETICECRKKWHTDPILLNWKKFVQGSNNCNVYAWAYDELVIKDPTNCKCENTICNCENNTVCKGCNNCKNDSCIYEDNKIKPLLNCPKTEDGNLLIKVFNVM